MAHVSNSENYEENPRPLFLTPKQILLEGDEDVPWVWPGYVARGNLTLLVGREKVGKSSLLFAAISAITRGGEVLGQRCEKTPVILLSEEGGRSIAEKVVQFGLVDEEAAPALIFDRRGRFLLKRRWKAIAQWARVIANETDKALIVVDALNFWGELKKDEENDSGAIREMLDPLLEATGSGLPVLMIHHLSKKGDSRGSTAIAASADIVMKLERRRDHSNRRNLDAVGRYRYTPDTVAFELRQDQFELVGGPSAGYIVTLEDREEAVLRALDGVPAGLKQSEIVQAAGLSQSTLSRLLLNMEEKGYIRSEGLGTRSDPKQWIALIGKQDYSIHSS